MNAFKNRGANLLKAQTKTVFEAWYQDFDDNWWCFRDHVKTEEEAKEAIEDHERLRQTGVLRRLSVQRYAVTRVVHNSRREIAYIGD